MIYYNVHWSFNRQIFTMRIPFAFGCYILSYLHDWSLVIIIASMKKWSLVPRTICNLSVCSCVFCQRSIVLFSTYSFIVNILTEFKLTSRLFVVEEEKANVLQSYLQSEFTSYSFIVYILIGIFLASRQYILNLCLSSKLCSNSILL